MALKTKPSRPMKYAAFLAILDNTSLYSAGLIIAIGESLGFFGYTTREERRELRNVAMRNLRVTAIRKLPAKESGRIAYGNKFKEKAWRGSMWKALLTQMSWDYARMEVRSFGFRIGDPLPELRRPRFIPKPKVIVRPVLPTAEQIREIRARNTEHARQRMSLTARRCAVVHAFFS